MLFIKKKLEEIDTSRPPVSVFIKKKKLEEIDNNRPPLFDVPVGVPVITGGSKVYSIYQALEMALLMYDGFTKVNKKKARALQPIVELWLSVLHDIEEYSLKFEEENFSDL